jgi:hypothetical protein
VKNLFGVANVLAVFEVIDSSGNRYSTEDILPKDATYLDIFKLQPDEAPSPEHRVLVYVIYANFGKTLDQVTSVKAVVESVFHVSIGL